MSINLLKGFEFERKDTFIHSLDPRTKLFITITFTILALMFKSFFSLSLFIISLLPLIILARISTRWIASIKGLSFILVFIVVLNTWLNSLFFAITMCLRIVLLVSAFSLFFMTVHPDELALSLLAMKVPFSFTFTLSLATRFVPTLANETQTIIDAQRSRGLELEKGGVVKRVKNMVPIIIPLIINSIKRAFSIAEALESKAFGAGVPRTNYIEVKMKARDYVVMIITTILVTLYLGIQLVVPLPQFMLVPL